MKIRKHHIMRKYDSLDTQIGRTLYEFRERYDSDYLPEILNFKKLPTYCNRELIEKFYKCKFLWYRWQEKTS